jgi:hypothetical protein
MLCHAAIIAVAADIAVIAVIAARPWLIALNRG